MILLSMSSGICSSSGECYDYEKAEPNFEQYEFQTRSCLKSADVMEINEKPQSPARPSGVRILLHASLHNIDFGYNNSVNTKNSGT